MSVFIRVHLWDLKNDRQSLGHKSISVISVRLCCEVVKAKRQNAVSHFSRGHPDSAEAWQIPAGKRPTAAVQPVLWNPDSTGEDEDFSGV